MPHSIFDLRGRPRQGRGLGHGISSTRRPPTQTQAETLTEPVVTGMTWWAYWSRDANLGGSIPA